MTQNAPDKYNLNIGERKIYRAAIARGKDDEQALMEAVGFQKFKEIQPQKDTSAKAVLLQENATLKASFKEDFLSAGKTTSEAERMAEIAVKGRDTTPVKKTSGKADLEESFYQDFVNEGRRPIQARRMAKVAVEGR